MPTPNPNRAPDERLAPCPQTPNCVSSLAEDPGRRMPPIRYRGSAGEARRLLLDLLGELPRVRVVEAGERLVRAEFTTPVFRFTDDVVFLVDPEAAVIHFRSASRIGHHDLGANRRRMKRFARRFRRAEARRAQ